MHVDVRGAQVMIERGRLLDGPLDLAQRLLVSAEILKIGCVPSEHLRIPGLISQELLEASIRLGDMSRRRRQDGQLGMRPPRTRIQPQSLLEAILRLLVLTRIEQLRSQGQPAERQLGIEGQRPTRHREGAHAIAAPAAELGVAQYIQGRGVRRFGGTPQMVFGRPGIAVLIFEHSE
jgi:hypothetical protein